MNYTFRSNHQSLNSLKNIFVLNPIAPLMRNYTPLQKELKENAMRKYLISEKGSFYKANLHCHTTVSDGCLTPEEVKAAYKEKGYEFQLNLMSLSGYYGRRPQAVSEALLKKGWYDYVGSDLHHLRRYAPMLESLKLKREQLDALSVLLDNNHTI